MNNEQLTMMEGWKEIKLKELISEMGDGGTPSTLDEGNFGGEIPWVVVDDVKPEIYSTKDSLTEQGFKSCSAKMWDVGTIILTTGATIGKVGIAKVPLCTKQGITGIVCNEHANNLFIRYWLEANEEQLIRYAQGTTFKEIRTRPLGNLKISIPNPFTKESVTEQTAIAAMLSKVDEAIAAVQGSIAAAERLKKSLMQNLLTGHMKPDGTLRTEEEFYLDEKFGKVPVRWVVKRLGYLFSIKAGGDLQEGYYSPIKDGTHAYPVFSNSLDNNGLYGYTSNPRFHAKESVTITGRGGVGHPEYRQGDYDAIIRLISLIPLQPDTIDCKYVCYYIGNYVHFALESTGVPQLTCPKVFSTKIMIPIDVKEQRTIGEMIHRFDTHIKEKRDKITVLEKLKKSLMQNLLTGRVRVNVQ